MGLKRIADQEFTLAVIGLDFMDVSAKALWYRTAAVGCIIMGGCLFLLPTRIVLKGLSLLPDEIKAVMWQAADLLWTVGRVEDMTHILAFAAITFMCLRAWHGRMSPMAIALIVYLCSGVVELLQIHVPGHSLDLSDLLANFVGVLLGWTAVGLLNLLKRIRPHLRTQCAIRIPARADTRPTRGRDESGY